jgi:hypothetical protein
MAMLQLPFVQPGVACGVLQMVPHVPQLLGSLAVLASQPSEACLSQSEKPIVQERMPHWPATHVGEPFGVLQRVPHVWQLEVS